ncbi:MAG: phage tail fiber protein [Leptodesmis sp.]|uniref:phage tail fiber protein n=1 Tax=Leptodesmis sp. TaxID=3100501 RepID=UPI003D09F046
MASNIGNFLVQSLLNAAFGGVTYTPPATIFVALFTVAPTSLTAGTGGTEVTGGGYARAAVANNTTNFPSISGTTRVKTTGANITFTTPSANWGTVTAFAFYDASSGGNYLGGGDLTSSKTINAGDTVTFNTGNLTITVS